MSRSVAAVESEGAKNRYTSGWRAAIELIRRGRSWSGRERNCAFLNTGRGGFKNAAGALGLDFDDDGRGLAAVDWDRDGDLDLVTTNRTAPRLRILRNRAEELSPAPRTLSLRLVGVDCNRDAVGARVEVEWEGGRRSAQTVRAGEGFLSQSPPGLCFGAGEGVLERLTVRWPGGEPEEFRIEGGTGRRTLVQGTGVASEPTAERRVVLAAGGGARAGSTAAARVPLPDRVPMPTVRWTRFGQADEHVLETGPAPTLINLWASWCAPCVAELGALTAEETRLREAGLNVISLTVDGLGEDTGDPAAAEAILERLAFPFERGRATASLLAKIELLQESLFHLHRPLVVPFSLLLDGRGRLAVIYRGPVQPDALLADVGRLASAEGEVFFAGRRYGEAPGIGPWLAAAAEVFGEVDPADELLFLRARRDWVLARLEQRRAEGLPTRPQEAQLAELHFELANRSALGGEAREALRQYRLAIELDPAHARAHNNLGRVLLSMDRVEQALEHFERALRLDPDLEEASLNLKRARRRLAGAPEGSGG